MSVLVGEGRRFYGWPLVGIGFLVYGLGIGPGYYSWGFFAPEVIADIGLTREQVGQIFGAFTLTFAVARSSGPTRSARVRSSGKSRCRPTRPAARCRICSTANNTSFLPRPRWTLQRN